MKEKFIKLKQFITSEIWDTDIKIVSKQKRFIIQFFRVFSIGMKSFKEDKLNIRASALTYFSILSIIPVFALAFGIAKGFGLEKILEAEITKSMAGQKEALTYILKFTSSMLNNTKGGIVAGIGLILLLWSVMKLLINIEDAFNTVWEVEKARTPLRKFTDYISIMIFAPILLIVASSSTVLISSLITNFSKNAVFGLASPALLQLAQLIPLVIMWAAFTLLYLVMPNTKVNFKSALIGAIIAGTIFQLFQTFYVHFQSGATRMNAIYGSFVALPLFLIWMQTSWFVVLLGAEISFAVQNVKTKGRIIDNDDLSIKFQKKIALLVTKIIIDNFEKGKKAFTSQDIASEIQLNIQTVEFIIQKLINANIISRIYNNNKDFTYQPAESTNNLNINKVISKFENQGFDNSKIINSLKINKIEVEMNRIEKEFSESKNNKSLRNLEI